MPQNLRCWYRTQLHKGSILHSEPGDRFWPLHLHEPHEIYFGVCCWNWLADKISHNIYDFFSGNTPETRGTAFVVYEDIFDAKNACDHLSGFNVCNRYLVVLYYQSNKAFKKLDADKKEADLAEMKRKYGLATPGKEETKWMLHKWFRLICTVLSILFRQNFEIKFIVTIWFIPDVLGVILPRGGKL